MLSPGQVYRATLKVGDGTIAASSVTLTVTRPDGVTETPVITNSPAGSGSYYVDYPLTMAGLYRFAWVTQGPGTAPAPDYVSVRDFISIISMGEALAHLNITRPLPDGGLELQRFMQASTELVEAKVGICVRRSFTDQIDEAGYAIALPRRPVLSVTSVTSLIPGGWTWNAAQLIVDNEAGVIRPQWGNWPFFNWPPFVVSYECGRTAIPERFAHAAKEQLRHLWETQRGAQPPSLLSGEQEFTATSGWSFSVPRRVLELLEQDMVPSS